MITTHVLDTSRGGPAVGMTVILEMRQASEWSRIGRGTTDGKGWALQTILTAGGVTKFSKIVVSNANNVALNLDKSCLKRCSQKCPVLL